LPLWRYFWTTIVGYMPVTALSVYFGTRLEGIRATDPLVIGVVLALLALLAIGHFIVRRQAMRQPTTALATEEEVRRPA
jgi:uncharacterized membrane protein YdjX (TVP38/TMEM64 family)